MAWNPDDYARHSQVQLAWACQLIERLELRGSESVVDVGCGDGKVTAELARLLPAGSVLGVDSSPAFVDYARRNHPPEAHPNLRFERMDARRLAWTRQFDVVFSNAALHWVDDHPAFLAGSARLLVPRGRLTVSCGGAGNAAGIVEAMSRVIRRPEWAAHFNGFEFPYFFYSARDYERWCPEAGLQPMRLELVEKDMVHSGREGLAGWIRTTWMPYTHRVREWERDRFILECVDAYLEAHPADASGRTHVTMVRLEVDAVRVGAGEGFIDAKHTEAREG